MRKKYPILFLFLIFLYGGTISAQITESVFDEEVLKKRVDLLDIFFERFNFERDFDRGKIANPNDVDLHKKYILSLFDRNYLMDTSDMVQYEERKTLAMAFMKEVTNPQAPTRLAYSDSTWFAQVVCNCKYEKESRQVALWLKPEMIRPNEYKWVIFDADADFLHLPVDTSSVHLISPVEHEMQFMGLYEISNTFNYNSVVDYADMSFAIDPLSVFFTMIYDQRLTIADVADMEYHFFNVPGYEFVVRFIERSGINAGWLITGLKKI